MLPTSLQPDQEVQRWDDHVLMYEAVFVPFTLQFAHAAISALSLAAGQSSARWLAERIAFAPVWPRRLAALATADPP